MSLYGRRNEELGERAKRRLQLFLQRVLAIRIFADFSFVVDKACDIGANVKFTLWIGVIGSTRQRHTTPIRGSTKHRHEAASEPMEDFDEIAAGGQWHSDRDRAFAEELA